MKKHLANRCRRCGDSVWQTPLQGAPKLYCGSCKRVVDREDWRRYYYNILKPRYVIYGFPDRSAYYLTNRTKILTQQAEYRKNKRDNSSCL